MITNTIDITTAYAAAANGYVQDLGGWDYCVVQLVSPSASTAFAATNDGGGVTGESDGSAETATNFTAVTGTNLATGTGVTSLAVSGMVKFNVIGRYLKIGATGVTATKVILSLSKIG